MSEENVEVVRRIYERTAQGHPEVLYEAIDPEVEVDISASGLPEVGVYRGKEGVREWRRRWWGTWETPRNEPEQFIDAGERVVVMVRMGGRGKASGVEVEQRFAQVWTFRQGKVTRLALYHDRSEALEAAGLSE